MPPKLTSRQLQYDAPPIPNFLKQLHGQVNARNGNINDKRPQGIDDDFGDLLSGPSSTKGADRQGHQSDDEEGQDWDGAQIVILKEGKHLSKEDVEGSKRDTLDDSGALKDGEVESGVSSVKIEAGGSKTTKSNVKDSMKDAKDLIAESKTKSSQDSESEDKYKRKLEKEKQREEKNKRAKIEKSKRGKGLSFRMDD